MKQKTSLLLSNSNRGKKKDLFRAGTFACLMGKNQKTTTESLFWRELGGHRKIYFRLESNGQLELMGHIASPEEISILCRELERKLVQEYEVRRICTDCELS